MDRPVSSAIQHILTSIQQLPRGTSDTYGKTLSAWCISAGSLSVGNKSPQRPPAPDGRGSESLCTGRQKAHNLAEQHWNAQHAAWLDSNDRPPSCTHDASSSLEETASSPAQETKTRLEQRLEALLHLMCALPPPLPPTPLAPCASLASAL